MKYDKVVRAGINGCGNIVVEQILNYLFDQTNNELDRTRSRFYRPANSSDKVIHTFRYIDNLEPSNNCHNNGLSELYLGVIIPNRDFRSALASQMRKRDIPPTETTIRKMYQDLFLVMYKERHKYTVKFPSQEDILVLDYSKYFNDLDYLIDKLQWFLEIDVSEIQRSKIHSRFSMKTNIDISNRMNNWSQVDTDSGVHGRHIGTGLPESWITFFPQELHHFVTKLMWNELVEYGWEDRKG